MAKNWGQGKFDSKLAKRLKANKEANKHFKSNDKVECPWCGTKRRHRHLGTHFRLGEGVILTTAFCIECGFSWTTLAD